MGKIYDLELTNMWDWAFLAIFIGTIIQIMLFSFATRVNMAFYWLMVLIDIPLFVVGIILSNIWQGVVVNPEFVETVVRFPITNALLGTYFPMAMLIIFFISSILLFGKRPGEL